MKLKYDRSDYYLNIGGLFHYEIIVLFLLILQLDTDLSKVQTKNKKLQFTPDVPIPSVSGRTWAEWARWADDEFYFMMESNNNTIVSHQFNVFGYNYFGARHNGTILQNSLPIALI